MPIRGSEDHLDPSDLVVGVWSARIGDPGFSGQFAVGSGIHFNDKGVIPFYGIIAFEDVLKLRSPEGGVGRRLTVF